MKHYVITDQHGFLVQYGSAPQNTDMQACVCHPGQGTAHELAEPFVMPSSPAPSWRHRWNVKANAWMLCPSIPAEDMDDVRYKRDKLLQASDWTQLPDVPEKTKQAWAGYRQALRDITTQPDPANIVWPQEP